MLKKFKFLNCAKNSSLTDDEIDARPDEKTPIVTRRVSYLEKTFVKEPTGEKVSRPTHETHYKSDHPHIGVAVIFNQINVPNHAPRQGTEKDKNRIRNILDLYGFDVRCYDDPTYSQIAQVLTDISEEDHTNNDCLLVIVMSHGGNGLIYSADRPYIIEDLWTPFLGENCPTLINKPKLFFIQACRGTRADPGAIYTTDAAEEADSHQRCSDEVDGPIAFTIPSTADSMLFYSTIEGYVSYRNPTDGSWFIQTICILLEEYFGNNLHVDLYYFATTVNRKVAYECQSNFPKNEKYNNMKAMPNFVSTLTKMFTLKPKPRSV